MKISVKLSLQAAQIKPENETLHGKVGIQKSNKSCEVVNL